MDPVGALEAWLGGFQAVTLESVVDVIDIFTTTTGNFNIITLEYLKKMKNNAIVGNIGHFDNRPRDLRLGALKHRLVAPLLDVLRGL
jgi:adenosylhomocysteinase